ncbi:MAG: hypothetical protein HDR48_00760 [Bacteroides sp.]|nr:hypothetical protein [Bacteroides sp.]
MRIHSSRQHNKRFHIGIICRCIPGEDIGIIHGVKRHPYNGVQEVYEQKYFYFSKDINYALPCYAIVFYYSTDYDEFNAKAEYVSLYESIKMEEDTRGSYRPYNDYQIGGVYHDGAYHDDECWQHIINGIPYLDVNPYCLVYPVIEEERFGEGQYCYLIKTVFSSLEDYFIRCCVGIENCKFDYKEHSYDNLSMFIEKTVSYINNLDIDNIISEYSIVREESLCRRPGKDDHYFIYKSSYLNSEDEYLKSLLPVKRDLIDYDLDWSSASDEDNTGIYYLQEETESVRNNAKTAYSKERHLAFLIERFLKNKEENIQKLSELKKSLHNFLIPEEEIDFYNYEPKCYIDLIEKFNQKERKIEF